jgi:hypothetical protein
MKADAIDGNANILCVRFDSSRLTRCKPRGRIHPADLLHSPADARGLTCGDCRGVREHGMAVIYERHPRATLV